MVMKKILLVIVIAMVGTLNALAQDVDSLQIDSTETSLDSLVVKLNTYQRNTERDKEEISLESEELQLSLTPQDLWQTGLQHEQRKL